MRGTRTPASRESVQNGIIPAYAGNTSLSGNLEDFGGDHPRVCGEHVRNDRAIEARAGSSPRMRGTQGAHVPHRRTAGIIPAYAGNTSPSRSANPMAKDHPRVCGEHKGFYGHALEAWGSSPRMRGTLSEERNVDNKTGIIPAYAGNTRKRRPTENGLGDHPRVCGEHTKRL